MQDFMMFQMMQTRADEVRLRAEDQSARRRHEKIMQLHQLNQVRRPIKAIQSIEEPQLPAYNPYQTPRRTLTPAATVPRSRSYTTLPDARPSSPV